MLKIEVICSCGFKGMVSDLKIDDENHRHYFCPLCCLDGGLIFISEKIQPKDTADEEKLCKICGQGAEVDHNNCMIVAMHR